MLKVMLWLGGTAARGAWRATLASKAEPPAERPTRKTDSRGTRAERFLVARRGGLLGMTRSDAGRNPRAQRGASGAGEFSRSARAAAMIFSISSGSRGRRSVRNFAPVAVTRTSSSMRTPIFSSGM